ncbi:Calcineurin-like phosphoesterase [Geosmithia morbida]|uniref:Calcineurin-like phosphoesterase n=1 Tax=Geosmithia morbida TaxID=1094350 RepID=A0A9P5CZQ2_9HYPO|nr:Calcineurin-like phosphoesterase [Geosmithia morbida]KAF4121848.1 Calcineurin-like phosphoesterase [Geosmithia morbida]
MSLDPTFHAKHDQRLHGDRRTTPHSHADCLSLFTSSKSITYLNHEATTVRLTSPSGPRTTFRIFGSPYSPRCGLWGFSYDRDTTTAELSSHEASPPPEQRQHEPSATRLWESIPSTADIVVTHTPPRGHLDDRAGAVTGAGCEALRRRLARVRPILSVCGHVHGGRGAQRVSWPAAPDSGGGDEARDAVVVTPWEDPSPEATSSKMSLVDLTGRRGGAAAAAALASKAASAFGSGSGAAAASAAAYRERKETCIVNAAIVGTDYPHIGGKQLNKPIVVDVELPVWEEDVPDEQASTA